MNEKTTKPPDILTILGRQQLKLDEPWSCCGWKRIASGFLLNFGQERIITKGKRKGQRTWKGEQQQAFVTDAEIKKAEGEWEKQTGKCHVCGGDGQESFGWNAKTGTTYDTCTRCGGAGTINTTK
jgi:hypothetical protein